MTTFFKPSDIKTIECTVSNLTRGGSAFAVCENEDQVFISPKITDQMQLQPGDFLTAYCIDNHRAGVEREYSVRWRAIRVKAVEPFRPDEKVEEKVEATFEEKLNAIFDMEPQRAYHGSQLSKMLDVETIRVTNWVNHQHEYGRLVAAKLYKSGDQERASRVYFARSLLVFDRAFE